jgi:glycosyltransferase involved in cell wall biosynthesis
MKLLHIIASMNPLTGGPCQVIRNIIPEMKNMGVYGDVVCLDDPKTISVVEEQFEIFALGPSKNSWRFNRILDKWLNENLHQYFAVIVHGLWLYHSYALSKAIRRFKKQNIAKIDSSKLPKVYIMPHGMLDPYFQIAKNRKFKAIRNVVYWTLIENKIIHDADGILFTCEEELRLARNTFKPYKPKQEINVGLGIQAPPIFSNQMEKAFKAALGNFATEPYLLFLGRIHEKKGVELLLKAYAKLAETLSIAQPFLLKETSLESGLCASSLKQFLLPKLVIAGPGIDSPFGLKIQMLTNNNQYLKNSVIFTGMLVGNKKWSILYGCEAFILPSHQENFGVAVAEALACGKPVLISNKVNIWREIIECGGGLVADDTFDGIYKLLQSWICLSSLEKKMQGQRAQEAFKNHFSVGPATRQLVEAIS